MSILESTVTLGARGFTSPLTFTSGGGVDPALPGATALYMSAAPAASASPPPPAAS